MKFKTLLALSVLMPLNALPTPNIVGDVMDTFMEPIIELKDKVVDTLKDIPIVGTVVGALNSGFDAIHTGLKYAFGDAGTPKIEKVEFSALEKYELITAFISDAEGPLYRYIYQVSMASISRHFLTTYRHNPTLLSHIPKG
jgi:hypothetical protein